jgi:hypothetical protein
MRAFREMTGSTLGGSKGGVMSVGAGDTDTRGAQLNILRYGHKNILFLTLVSRKIFVITIITKAFELAFNHFGLGQFLDM